MTGPEILAFAKEIVNATRNGPVQEWVERIASVVRDSGLPPEDFQWQLAPEHLAVSIVDIAQRCGMDGKLRVALERYISNRSAT